ncbi:MAG: hypothetical protein H6811_02655 [Phycisphaeraceae bacterium]|nr:hypothetical protein [Phycisphaeraceae bacterium]
MVALLEALFRFLASVINAVLSLFRDRSSRGPKAPASPVALKVTVRNELRRHRRPIATSIESRIASRTAYEWSLDEPLRASIVSRIRDAGIARDHAEAILESAEAGARDVLVFDPERAVAPQLAARMAYDELFHVVLVQVESCLIRRARRWHRDRLIALHTLTNALSDLRSRVRAETPGLIEHLAAGGPRCRCRLRQDLIRQVRAMPAIHGRAADRIVDHAIDQTHAFVRALIRTVHPVKCAHVEELVYGCLRTRVLSGVEDYYCVT